MSAESTPNSNRDIHIRATCGDVRCSKGMIVQHFRVRPDLELFGSVVRAGLISGHARLIGGLLLGTDASVSSAIAEALGHYGEHQITALLTTEERIAVARLYLAEALLAGTTSLLVCGGATANGILEGSELRTISALLGIRVGLISSAGSRPDVESPRSGTEGDSSADSGLLHLGAVSSLSDDEIRRRPRCTTHGSTCVYSICDTHG